MKKVFLLFFMALLAGSLPMMAVQHHHHATAKTATTTVSDSTGQTVVSTSYSPDYTDSVDDANDSISSDDDDANVTVSGINSLPFFKDYGKQGMFLGALTIIGIFILPPLIVLLIIFLIIYYNYKSRKAKYQLAQKAIENGKPIPSGVFNKQEGEAIKTGKLNLYDTSLRDKAIKKMFIGFGLFLFLMFLTGEFGVGCIGLLVMLYGASQFTTWYLHQKDAEKYGIPKQEEKTQEPQSPEPETDSVHPQETQETVAEEPKEEKTEPSAENEEKPE
jgi:ABC-type multidrug transport system fused ATPase/permease subunit